MTESKDLNYGILGDIHGEYEKLSRVIDACESEVDQFIFLGDVMDGPNTAGVIRLIRSLGDKAITIAGNHEWVYWNVLNPEDNQFTEVCRSQVWPDYEENTLASYGLKRAYTPYLDAARLREAMQNTGDLDWLNTLPPYVETEDFIALHAGPILDEAWSDQATFLDYAAHSDHRLYEEPDQVFSTQLARLKDVPTSVDDRIFVTGHTHLNLPIRERIGSQRVRLASDLRHGAPIPVWFSANQTIKEYTF